MGGYLLGWEYVKWIIRLRVLSVTGFLNTLMHLDVQ